jgi:hypothetical protein
VIAGDGMATLLISRRINLLLREPRRGCRRATIRPAGIFRGSPAQGQP